MISEDSFRDGVLRLADRMRKGWTSYAATVDLLATSAMLEQNPHEAQARLNDLQQGFADGLEIFPGGEDYRVCFAGDSIFVVRELEPGTKSDHNWAQFCGHIYALTSLVVGLEQGLGNSGPRTILSQGRLWPVHEPMSWRRPGLAAATANWFVLTGANEAFAKCVKAEGAGQNAGFLHGYAWHERPDIPLMYDGTTLARVPMGYAQQPNLYPDVYVWMRERATKTARLPQQKTR